MTKRTQILQLRLGLLLLSFIYVAALAAFWEFSLEGMGPLSFGSSYDGNYEDAERRRFIMTSTGFATLSPGHTRLLVSLSNGYPEITEARQETFGWCSGQLILATRPDCSWNSRSDSFGVKPPLYQWGRMAL
ncbi:hypothetical protein JNO12_24075 [Erwinia aphidicola]|nr:hypothetical protein [Erwinia aphidicola]